MKDEATPVNTMAELPHETREFLARLRPDDLATLERGVKLVNSILTVGTFMKWAIVGILGMFVGFVMLIEAAQKIWGWVKP